MNSTTIALADALDPAYSQSEDVHALVEQHLPLVHAIARGWRNRCRTSLEFGDLVQSGAVGLVEAAHRFDSSRDVTFAAFASGRIRGAICDFLRAADPLTRGRRQAVKNLDRATHELGCRLLREPSGAELAEHLAWDDGDMQQASADRGALSRGWAMVQEAPDGMSERAIAADPQPDPFEALEATELRARLAGEIARLPERDQRVLALSYLEQDELTLREIGEILGVTESRVCQLRTAAVARLRARMTEGAVSVAAA